MSQQIQITGGAKVRSLEGVITGTTGVLNSLPINGSLGIPQLDVNGKILVSQLPNSVMEYLGTWDASTNTPTLVNGTGNAGDVYLCNVAGTVNFGAGPISFVVSDQVIYSGSIWQKASGTSGTVTSVAASITGNSLGITGSPITTAGTLAFAFAGTNLQYVNGAGNLTTFPTLISSIGLSMPSAFSVSNSPLTANGTIAVTGAGYPSQYIRGDGTLADFPTSGGGGSSVSYYLNGGTSQGVIGGTTYYEMSKTAVIGTGVDFPLVGNGLIVAFLTDAGDPAQLNIPAGNWNYEIYASMSANGGTPQMYAELYKYDGTTFTLIATSSNEILYDGVNLNLYTFAMAVPATSLFLSDRLAVLLYATNSGGKTTTVHTQDGHLCQVITTFSTGITALNNLTAQVQYFATGTSGSDFNISSSTATHTFNIPDAGASARGLITTGTQTIGGVKTFSSAITGDSGILLKTGSPTSLVGYTGLSGDDGNLQIIGKVGSTSYINNLQFTSSTANTYTFPNASGTVALTSSLSSYVPYTGALTAVNLGSFDLTVNGVSIGRGLASISTNTLVGNNGLSHNTTGYHNTAIGINSLMNNTTGYGNSSVGSVSLGNNTTGILNTSFGYSSLTANISGNYNVAVGANSLLNNTGGDYNVAIGTQSLQLNTTGFGNTALGYSSLQSNTTGLGNTVLGYGSGINITTGTNNTIVGNYGGTATMNSNIILSDGQGNVKYRWDGTNNNLYGNVNFSSTIGNGTYTYTLPSATGTLALTSDLAAYVTLATDQTISGAKTFTSIATNNVSVGIKFTSSITTTAGYLSLNSKVVGTTNTLILATDTATNTALISFNNTASRTYTLPDASGTLALTSNLSSYLPLAGGTLTGALTGTSATFKVNADRNLAIKYDTNIAISAQNDAGNPESVRYYADTFRIYTGTTAGGLTERFTIANTGAATFSSSVTALNYFSTAATTSYAYSYYANTGASMYMGIERSTGGGLFTNSSAYATVFGSTNATSLQFGTNGIIRQTISSDGNVGIGSVPSSWSGVTALQIGGYASFAGDSSFVTYVSSNAYYNGGWKYIGVAAAANYYQEGGAHYFRSTSTTGAAGGAITWTNPLTIASTGNVGIGASANANYRTFIQAPTTSGSSYGLLIFAGTTSADTALAINNATDTGTLFVVKGNGNVGIGMTPTYKLQLSTDSAAKPTSALWTIASDERIKENINPYKKGLQELLKINPITYDYNGLGGFVKGKGGVGIIAQEIIDILPDSVSSIKAKLNETDEDETNILNFNGHELIYVLINSIKEQQATITSLQDRLDKLENK